MSKSTYSSTHKGIYETRDMRVLVCGGAGYIGSNMTAMLAVEGFEPVVYDNISTGHRSAVGSAEFVEGDLADYEFLIKTLKKYKIESVMHFAAFIEVGESVQAPLKYYRNNVSILFPLCQNVTIRFRNY